MFENYAWRYVPIYNLTNILNEAVINSVKCHVLPKSEQLNKNKSIQWTFQVS
jgi:hypothetical protein